MKHVGEFYNYYMQSAQLLFYYINGKIFEEIAFAHDVHAMKPFQCRHKCKKKNVTLKEIQSTFYSQNTVINVTCMALFSYIAINKSLPQTAIWLNQHQAIMPSWLPIVPTWLRKKYSLSQQICIQ